MPESKLHGGHTGKIKKKVPVNKIQFFERQPVRRL